MKLICWFSYSLFLVCLLHLIWVRKALPTDIQSKHHILVSRKVIYILQLVYKEITTWAFPQKLPLMQ